MASNSSDVRLGLIGPVLPYRGGVARHTTLLHRALVKRSKLTTVAFSRLYPPRLYPGRGQREPDRRTYREPGVAYNLSSVNPLTWLRVAGQLRRERVETLVLVWWTAFMGPCYFALTHLLGRTRPRIVFLCHNASDHEESWASQFLSRLALSRGDAFLAQSECVKRRIEQIRPGAPIEVHHHPVFDDFPSAGRRLKRRARLELLFFGFVRHYKGLDYLVRAMEMLRGEDVHLTVAGEWWMRDELLWGTARRLGNIELIDRYVPEAEVGELFERADVVVLPYRAATGTGVIPLAYHYGRPVLATRVGGLPDVVEDGVTGRLILPENPAALAEGIRSFMNGGSCSSESIRRLAQEMNWESLATAVLNLAGRS